jgi:hypothetical protein
MDEACNKNEGHKKFIQNSVEKTEGKTRLAITKRKWEYNIKRFLKEQRVKMWIGVI